MGSDASTGSRRRLDALSAAPALAAAFALTATLALPWFSAPSLRAAGAADSLPLPALLEGIGALLALASGAGTQPGAVPASVEAGVALLRALAGLSAACALAGGVLAVRRRELAVRAVRALFALSCAGPAGAICLLVAVNASLAAVTGGPVGFVAATYGGALRLAWPPAAQLALGALVAAFAPRLLEDDGGARARDRYPVAAASARASAARRHLSLAVLALLAPALMAFGALFLGNRSQVLIGLLMAVAAMMPVAMRFEGRRPQARELLLIAVIVAMAVAGRLAFFMIPQFKPVAALTVIAGIWLGAETGALVGMMSAFVSNFFFGQGPWTPWQMLALGCIGFLAAAIFRSRGRVRFRNRAAICLYGGLSTLVVYGLLVDTASALFAVGSFSPEAVLGVYLAGLPFNAVHAASTVVFLYVLALPLGRKLERIQRKYGMLLS